MTEEPKGLYETLRSREETRLDWVARWFAEKQHAARVTMSLVAGVIVGGFASFQNPNNLKEEYPERTHFTGKPLPPISEEVEPSHPLNINETKRVRGGEFKPYVPDLLLNDKWVDPYTVSYINDLKVWQLVGFDGLTFKVNVTERTHLENDEVKLAAFRRYGSDQPLITNVTDLHISAIADYLRSVPSDEQTAIKGANVSSTVLPDPLNKSKDTPKHAEQGGLREVDNLVERLHSLKKSPRITEEERTDLIGHLLDAGAKIDTSEAQFSGEEWNMLDQLARKHPHIVGCDSLDPTTRVFSLIDFYQNHPQEVDQVVGDFLFNILSSKRLVKVTITTEQGAKVTRTVAFPVFLLYLILPTWYLRYKGKVGEKQNQDKRDFHQTFLTVLKKRVEESVEWNQSDLTNAIFDDMMTKFFAPEDNKRQNGYKNLTNFIFQAIKNMGGPYMDWYWWKNMGPDISTLIYEKLDREANLNKGETSNKGHFRQHKQVQMAYLQADFIIKLAVSWLQVNDERVPTPEEYKKMFLRFFEIEYSGKTEISSDGVIVVQKHTPEERKKLEDLLATQSNDPAHEAAAILHVLLKEPIPKE